MENKTQRKERLRKMRQKYHLGEYKNKSTRKRKVYKVGVSKINMVKRKSTRRYSKRKSMGGSSLNFQNMAIGIGTVLLYKNIVSPKVPLSGMTKTVAELGAGYYLSKKSGVAGQFGKTLILINLYALASVYFTPMLNSATSVSAGEQTVYY